MAEMRVELNITVRDKPFMVDGEILRLLNAALRLAAPGLIEIDSMKLVGPRRPNGTGKENRG